jgi:DNA polymerase
MIFLDYETRSMANLKIVGGRNYCRHPSTDMLVGVALIKGTAYVWSKLIDLSFMATDDAKGFEHIKKIVVSHSAPRRMMDCAQRGMPVVAHNAEGFDRWFWEAQGMPEAKWIDTLRLAGKLGLPGGLDKLSKTLYDQGKHEGGKLMLKLSIPTRKGTFFPLNSQNMRMVTQYCLYDVDLMARAWFDHLADIHQDEYDVMQMDSEINRRGFLFDDALAERIVACDAMNRQEALDALPIAGEVLRSNKQLAEWLHQYEVDLPNFQRATINSYLEDNPNAPEIIQQVLLGRIGATKITSAKVSRAIGLQGKDKRIRNGLMYHAAHTGRWGGRGFQPHNLPRGIEMNVEEAADRLLTDPTYQPTDAELSTLIRACIKAPKGKTFAVVDYSQIEARVLPWLAGDMELLKRIESGWEIYEAMTEVMGLNPKTQRKIGKVGTLGCGFQSGGNTLGAFAAGYGIDFADYGLTAQEVVEMYRDGNPKIAGVWNGSIYNGIKVRKGGLWRILDAGLKELAWGREREFFGGRCHWEKRGMNLHCTLPSGRTIVYREFTIEDWVPSWGGDPKPTMVYTNRRGIRVPTYGGKLTENITQAVARDIMADALVKLSGSRFWKVVLHVHDEVVAEVSNLKPETRLSQICDIMRDKPKWAVGLPVDVDGFVTARYCKR